MPIHVSLSLDQNKHCEKMHWNTYTRDSGSTRTKCVCPLYLFQTHLSTGPKQAEVWASIPFLEQSQITTATIVFHCLLFQSLFLIVAFFVPSSLLAPSSRALVALNSFVRPHPCIVSFYLISSVWTNYHHQLHRFYCQRLSGIVSCYKSILVIALNSRHWTWNWGLRSPLGHIL